MNLFCLHLSEGTLTAFETSTIRTFMLTETVGTNAIAAGITYKPTPIMRELMTATLTRY